jgi:hypothetical protein
MRPSPTRLRSFPMAARIGRLFFTSRDGFTNSTMVRGAMRKMYGPRPPCTVRRP